MPNFIKAKTLLALVSTLLFFADVNAAPTPLSYQRWKNQQVVDAKNQVARLNNEIQMLKLGTKRPAQGDVPSEIAMLESRLVAAKENEKFAQSLAMEHYVAVHLNQFKGDSQALKEAAKSMKPDELGLLLKVLLQTGNADATSTSSPAATEVYTPKFANWIKKLTDSFRSAVSSLVEIQIY